MSERRATQCDRPALLACARNRNIHRNNIKELCVCVCLCQDAPRVFVLVTRHFGSARLLSLGVLIIRKRRILLRERIKPPQFRMCTPRVSSRSISGAAAVIPRRPPCDVEGGARRADY